MLIRCIFNRQVKKDIFSLSKGHGCVTSGIEQGICHYYPVPLYSRHFFRRWGQVIIIIYVILIIRTGWQHYKWGRDGDKKNEKRKNLFHDDYLLVDVAKVMTILFRRSNILYIFLVDTSVI